MTLYFAGNPSRFYDTVVHGERTILIPDPDWVRPTKRVPDPAWERPTRLVPDESWTPPLVDVPDPGWVRPTKLVVDPTWSRPLVDVPDPDWKPGKGKKKRPMVKRPDVSAVPPEIEVLDEAAPPATISVPDETAERPMIEVPDEAAEPPLVDVLDEAAEPPLIEVANPACAIPAEAVEITPERHRELMEAQAAGKEIVAGEDGYPIAVDPLPPPADVLEALRRRSRNRLLKESDWTQLPDVLETMDPARQAAWRTYRQQLRDLVFDAVPFEFPAKPE